MESQTIEKFTINENSNYLEFTNNLKICTLSDKKVLIIFYVNDYKVTGNDQSTQTEYNSYNDTMMGWTLDDLRACGDL
jgi:hypothetical protein